ncbi:MAG: radical SAM protein [Lachnospiraceae bacterium]|nr:radical SAM protein [Lachnospiraceae bacterium]
MEDKLRLEFERIKHIKKEDYMPRFGKLFNTNFSNYFYDTGTGKVVSLDDEEYELMTVLFSKDDDGEKFKAVFEELSLEKQLNFLETCSTEKLLRAKKVEDLKLVLDDTDLEDQIMNHTKQLVLEVTEKCNFRCKYCIYNEDYEGDRNFGMGVMEWETAKKAIDYVMDHSGSTVSVTFYGGEPLLNYKVIKSSIEYALKKGNGKDLSFSITSNMTLMTKEMAQFFASVPKLSFLASLDGPEMVQNAARVYSGNKPTFDDTMKGLHCLANAFENSQNILMINSVLIPPYEYGKINAINDFFEGLDFLPNNTEIRITYPQLDTYPFEHWDRLVNNEKYLFYGTLDPLTKWQVYQARNKGLDKENCRNIYFYPMYSLLRLIDGRRRSEEPFDFYPCNGCCVPGARKVYVKTNGDIQVCEKIGTSPVLGNIETGINIQKVQEVFVDNYVNASIADCAKCWAINICGNCYANSYTETGIDIENKRQYCMAMQEAYKDNLSVFYTLMEECPGILDVLKGSVYANP